MFPLDCYPSPKIIMNELLMIIAGFEDCETVPIFYNRRSIGRILRWAKDFSPESKIILKAGYINYLVMTK